MIYFDNSATTKPSDEVLEAYLTVSRDYFGNPSSLHTLGGKAEQLISIAREQISNLAGVKPTEIYFTSGGSEGNNLAIKGTALAHRGRGNHIVTTRIEHPSVYAACEQLSALGFEITYVPVDNQGHISAVDVINAVTEQTIIVSMIHVNNEVGSIQPIKEVGKLLKKFPKVLYHVDHVQGAGKVPLDLANAMVDLCTFSAHKFNGLKGSGFLYVRDGVTIEPLISGGNQERRLRSGTENTGGIVAMAKAFRLAEEHREQGIKELLRIRNYMIEGLKKMAGIVIHTPEIDVAPHIINISSRGLKGEVLVHALAEEGFIVSTTSACSSKDKTPSGTLKAMGVTDELAQSAIRISLSYENTIKEAKQFIAVFQQVYNRLIKVVRRIK